MPITNQWWTFSESVIQHDHDNPGVYELGDASKNVVYIGSSNEVRRRLREHLAAHAQSCIGNRTKFYRIEYTQNYVQRERELYDSHVRLHGQRPICNDVRP